MNIERQTLIPPRAMKCFQQLKAAIVCRSKNTLLPNKFLVADHYSTLSADYGKVVQNDAVDDFQHVQDTKQSSSTSQTSKTGHYQYVSDRNTGIVWKNVGLFLLLHGTYFFAVYLFFTRDTHKTWMFSKYYLVCYHKSHSLHQASSMDAWRVLASLLEPIDFGHTRLTKQITVFDSF